MQTICALFSELPSPSGAKAHSGSPRSKLALAVALALGAAGCGSANMLSQSDEFPEDAARRPRAGAFPGSTNVSDAPDFEPSFESQSAAAVLGSRAFIAYRAGDPRFVDYLAAGGSEDQRICAGASELSYSVGAPLAQVYQRVRLDPPQGISVLSGPVAATAFANAVFLSALASPADRFAASTNDGECVRTSQAARSGLPRSLADAGALAGACITNLPGYGVSCVRHGNDRFEGGSLAATARFVYAAYRNATRNELLVYRASSDGDFVELRIPGDVRADHDVAVTASGSRVFVAYLRGTELWFRAFDEASDAWQPPELVTRDANRRTVPRQGRRAEIAVRAFTFGVMPGEPSTTLAFFWHRRVGSTQKTTLRGLLCDTSRAPACPERGELHLRISNASNNFLPTLASVSVREADGTRSYRHVLSYWSDRKTRDGRVRLRVARFDRASKSESWAYDAVQYPCAAGGAGSAGDWGSSDASFVIGQDTTNPSLFRTITDSTQGSCSASGYRATPQHVSVLPLGF